MNRKTRKYIYHIYHPTWCIAENILCKKLVTENGDYSCVGATCTLECDPDFDVPEHINRIFTCVGIQWIPNDQEHPQCKREYIPYQSFQADVTLSKQYFEGGNYGMISLSFIKNNVNAGDK